MSHAVAQTVVRRWYSMSYCYHQWCDCYTGSSGPSVHKCGTIFDTYYDLSKPYLHIRCNFFIILSICSWPIILCITTAAVTNTRVEGTWNYYKLLQGWSENSSFNSSLLLSKTMWYLYWYCSSENTQYKWSFTVDTFEVRSQLLQNDFLVAVWCRTLYMYLYTCSCISGQ